MEPQPSDIDTGIRLIHEAGPDPQAWQAFLAHFSTMIDGVYAGLQGHDLRTNTSVGAISERYAPEYVASYLEHYAALNPWIPGMMTAPLGQALFDDALAPRETVLRSEYYADFLRAQEDISAGVALVLHRDAGRMFMFTANVRAKDMEALMEPLRRTMQAFAPHMARAFEAPRHVRSAAAGAVIDTLHAANPGDALFVLADDATVLRTNPAAEGLLRAGIVRRDGQGALRLDDPEATRVIEAVLAPSSFADPPPAPAILRGRRLSRPHVLCAYPLGAPASGDDPTWLMPRSAPVAIVIIRDPFAARETRLEAAATAFDLTPAERRLAEALLVGQTSAEHAESKGASPNTVRNQLHTLFQKTGTTGQVQLVLLLRDFFPAHGSNEP